jgi:hypothetical protein
VYTTSCHHEKRNRPWARKSSKEFNKAIYLWNESYRTPGRQREQRNQKRAIKGQPKGNQKRDVKKVKAYKQLGRYSTRTVPSVCNNWGFFATQQPGQTR